MARHRAPTGVHRAGSRTTARVVVIGVAVVTLVAALVLSTVAHRMSADPVVSTPVPTFLTPTPTPTPSAAPVPLPDCAAYGASVIPRRDPRYLPELDRDHDGFACDRNGDPMTPPHTMRSMAAHRL